MGTATGTPTAEHGPSPAELERIFRMKHGDPAAWGWGPRLRHRFGYFTPDDVYEATVAALVADGCTWVDVGCGRELFPGNRPLAEALAARCALLVGIDPDADDRGEPLRPPPRARPPGGVPQRPDLRPGDPAHGGRAHRAARGGRRGPGPDDRPGLPAGHLHRRPPAPAALAARALPFRLHHPIKRRLWRTEERDTFPVAYRMNSRRRLARLLGAHGFAERWFARPDDCRASGRFRALQFLELSLWRALAGGGPGVSRGVPAGGLRAGRGRAGGAGG